MAKLSKKQKKIMQKAIFGEDIEQKLKRIKQVLGKKKETPTKRTIQKPKQVITERTYDNKSRQGKYWDVRTTLPNGKTERHLYKQTRTTKNEAKTIANRIVETKYDNKGIEKTTWKEERKNLKRAQAKVSRHKGEERRIAEEKEETKKPTLSERVTRTKGMERKERRLKETLDNMLFEQTQPFPEQVTERSLKRKYAGNVKSILREAIKRQMPKLSKKDTELMLRNATLIQDHLTYVIKVYGVSATNPEEHIIVRATDTNKTMEEILRLWKPLMSRKKGKKGKKRYAMLPEHEINSKAQIEKNIAKATKTKVQNVEIIDLNDMHATITDIKVELLIARDGRTQIRRRRF